MPCTVYAAKDLSPINIATLKGITVLVSVPAAFSSTCTNVCVPGILEQADSLQETGVDNIIVIASDQPHAIQAWVKTQGWENSGLMFASDFGSFQLREIIGKLSDESGKESLPQVKGNLLRRAYLIVKDGKIVWQFVEPDSGQYTLSVETLKQEIVKL